MERRTFTTCFHAIGCCLPLLVTMTFTSQFQGAESSLTCAETRLPCSPPVSPVEGKDLAKKIELGRLLFFDTRLSADGTVACASCHNPRFAFTDGVRVSEGIGGQEGNRNSPTVINASLSTTQFWDGRAGSLEEQALGPLTNPIEMGNTSLDAVAERLRQISGYRDLFEKVFHTHSLTIDQVAEAIAAFERTVVSENSAFDRFRAGEKGALTKRQERGMTLFFGKARCHNCHGEPTFADGRFHNLGVGINNSKTDNGRSEVTKVTTDMGKFKTPTLREIAATAPYMHDGSLKSLEEVIDFYDVGGNPNPNINPRLRALALTPEEKTDLVSFLHSLSGEGWRCISAPREFPQ